MVPNLLTVKSAIAQYRIGHRDSLLKRVMIAQEPLRSMSPTELLRQSRKLEFQLKGGASLHQIVPDGFALVREATRRVLGIEHYAVQLLAGANLVNRTIVEMNTGEGKTLTALLPLYLFSLRGRGVLLATANDYLASRDAEGAQEILCLLGRKVGVVTAKSSQEDRKQAYASDITYGTANEFGFDVLRDRGYARANQKYACVGRGELHALIVDEADSLLIDEATTPLIIASPPPPVEEHVKAAFHWACKHAPKAKEGIDYRFEKKQDKVQLTPQGNKWAQRLPIDPAMKRISRVDCVEYLERAIKVHRNFHRDQQYVINGTEVLLVDEHTGRFGHGRQWSEGIQQAVQAKENLEISMPNGQMGRLTLQSLFLSYEHLSGMTGTARQSAREFSKVYKLMFARIPPHRKNRRVGYRDMFFKSEVDKFQAIAKETLEMVEKNRCVLVGTRSIEASLRLSAVFDEFKIDHLVLNANQSSDEADIISKAGMPKSVMIATSMAGRGTDIKLDAVAREAGGLHVILSELHDTPRIDRQLIGRSARQGDPGSYRRFLCASDEIVEVAQGLQRKQQTWRRANLRLADLYTAQSTVASRREIQRRGMFHQEKRRLKELTQSGFDALLDYVG